MQYPFIVYGAYGYTGKLIVERCAALGIKPLLAGRDEAKTQAIANSFNLPFVVVDINDKPAFIKLLGNSQVLLNCAGPFVHTAAKVAQYCLDAKVHYVDITGEYLVFEALAALDAQAKQAGITLLPGAGFDVVPSDCLALGLKNAMPNATHLQLAFAPVGGSFSVGTAKSSLEGMGNGGRIRKNGELVAVPTAYKVEEIDFGTFKAKAAVIPWGDISTAYRSTGIANIEVLLTMPPKQLSKLHWVDKLSWLLKSNWVKNYLRKQIEKRKPGPSEQRRAKSRVFFTGKATNAQGQSIIHRLTVPDGYTLTAQTAVEVCQRIANGNYKPGYQTPAMLYGADFITHFEGVELSN